MQLAKTVLHPTTSFMEELYQRHRQAILIYILQHVSSKEDAEDMLLEVFIAALESPIITTLDQGQQLAWLRRVALNKSIDYHRRSTRHPAVPIELANENLYEEEYHSPEQSVLRQEEMIHLRANIALLPELQQELLRLRFANDLRCAEIATHLDKSEGAVRTLLSRTLNALRDIYEMSRKESQHDQA
jgi:RNA polymerase sigma factor (sigma-70 family)